jgi:hypothetical protein
MPIFLFGCLDIRNPDWILRLNVKCCLDGQSEKMQLYETTIIILFIILVNNIS